MTRRNNISQFNGGQGESSLSIPQTVWVLGFVSLLMDASSELIHSLLPVFMVSALGAGAVAVGLVEGVAEGTALIVKVFSGALSDYRGKRKGLAVFGYGLAALSKPLFALAQTVNAVLGARFIDRIGKGLRGAPRDALIADVTPEPIRGAAYGLRQSLDTVGAFLGPIFAILLMVLFSGRFRTVFWFAAVPAVVSVGLLAVGIRERPSLRPKRSAGLSFRWRGVNRMDRGYWWVVGIGAVFTLARFSEAFLILLARQIGLRDVFAPAVFILMNIFYALSAYPAGRLADIINRRSLLAGGLVVLIAADLALAKAQGLVLAAVGVSLWGVHLGLTQGLFAAMVASAAPDDLRGTAFGIFNLVGGGALLLASTLAGFLWERMGSAATFYAGAGFSAAALLLLLRVSPE